MKLLVRKKNGGLTPVSVKYCGITVTLQSKTVSRTCLCFVFLGLTSGKLQSATETGCPFPAAGESFSSVLGVSLLLPAVMVTKVQCTGRGGLPSPACLDTNLDAPRSFVAVDVCSIILGPRIDKVISRHMNESKLSQGQS